MRRTSVGLLLGAAVAIVLAVGCEGTEGPIGPLGSTGAQGFAGPAGPAGEEGMAGLQGIAGGAGSAGALGETGAAGPQGERGSQGPPGETPSEEVLAALVDVAVARVSVSVGADTGPVLIRGDALAGGKLFDNWPVMTGVTPEGEHGLWAIQTTNTRTGVATWRCKECHGWDYRGALGAYGDRESSHYTGFLGLLWAGDLLTQDQIVEVLNGGLDPRHDFTDWLDDEQMLNVAAFLKLQLIDEAALIDYETKQPRVEWDPDGGKRLFERSCGVCHGDDGKRINFGSAASPEYLGGLAQGNPWEVMHKIRFGQPGTPGMPSSEARGWTIQDVIAVLGHAQTLPAQ